MAPPKNKGSAKVSDLSIDQLLEDLEKPTAPSPSKKKAKGKAKAKKEEDDDLDALLSSVGLAKPAEKPPTPPPTPPPAAEEDEDADQEEGEKEGEEISAKTLKNRLKKQKKKQKASAAAGESEEPQQASGPAVQAKAKAGPKSAAALRAQKHLQALQELERQRKEEEQRLREEQERLEALEKKRIEDLLAEKERKKKAAHDRKERLRKEGKPLTAAAKDRARRREIIKQQMIETMGPIDESLKRKAKVVKDKKKKKPASRPSEEEAKEREEDAQPTSPPPEEDQPSAPSSPVKSDALSEGEEEADTEKIWGELLDDGQEEKEDGEGENSSDSHNGESEESEVGEIKPQQKSNERKRVFAGSGANLDTAELRSPICCILGHVDTGKTKLLDKIRHTNVQSGEAGGITQQIGATFFPREALWEQCRKVDPNFGMRVPGLLIIDTPGHESFNNLRSRGSSLCDIAILVVDIMHGLEPQTRESLGLLRARKCPFIIALNKIDRLYAWATAEWSPAQTSLAKQRQSTQDEFEKRTSFTLLQLAEEGLNCELWWKIDDVRRIVSVAPTSAITGEGIPDLIMLLVRLTQTVITNALVFREEFQCSILEVKCDESVGTTLDVVLVSGVLHENDTIVVCGVKGPIVTTIRALLTPQPLKELRVKSEYIHHKEIRAAMGVKILAQGLEDAMAGTSILVARDENLSEERLEELKVDVMSDMATIFKSVNKKGVGVFVVASTLGSLEALLHFLKDSKIPVAAVSLGTVHKNDVRRASIMKEKNSKEYCCILAFDVKVDPDASKEAQVLGVKIFTADIIYHLRDAFMKYLEDEKANRKKEMAHLAVFPCVLQILPNCVFNKKDPIVVGVKVEQGNLRAGNPLCVIGKEKLVIGNVQSLEHNKKPVQKAKKGDEVSIKIVGDTSIMVGRHFEPNSKLYSHLSRDSIDCLKNYFRDEMADDDWRLVKKLKGLLNVD